ncbi:trehalase-like domain-containing protein [Kitasatospora sp. NPDC056076]|uniref:trehalase-like domain-containing protein n=1 Tax=Kitasatospora sp. NPDC056076 TaxID=3345703 RepID=UPI0035E06C65
MLRAPAPFRIEDLALLGNTRSAVLVRLDATINFACLPDFDSPAVFTSMLGGEEHGFWRVGPAVYNGSPPPSADRRQYLGDTLVFRQEWDTDTGTLAVAEFMPAPTVTDDAARRSSGSSSASAAWCASSAPQRLRRPAHRQPNSHRRRRTPRHLHRARGPPAHRPAPPRPREPMGVAGNAPDHRRMAAPPRRNAAPYPPDKLPAPLQVTGHREHGPRPLPAHPHHRWPLRHDR